MRRVGRIPAWALIAQARRRSKLTQVELATRAGTSQAAVARYERGQSLPSLDTLDRLVRACGFELRIHLSPSASDVRRAEIEERLAMTPEARLRSNDDLSGFVAQARGA